MFFPCGWSVVSKYITVVGFLLTHGFVSIGPVSNRNVHERNVKVESSFY